MYNSCSSTVDSTFGFVWISMHNLQNTRSLVAHGTPYHDSTALKFHCWHNTLVVVWNMLTLLSYVNRTVDQFTHVQSACALAKAKRFSLWALVLLNDSMTLLSSLLKSATSCGMWSINSSQFPWTLEQWNNESHV
jgi:hypothetical protein